MNSRGSRITSIFFTILTSVVIGIISGVIANRVDAFLFSSKDARVHFFANLLPWIIAGFFMLCFFGVTYLRWSDGKLWEKFLNFDEGLLRLLPNLIVGKSDLDAILDAMKKKGLDENEMKQALKDELESRYRRLIERLLTHTTKEFPDIRRGILLRPDKNRDGKYLIITNSVGFQEEYEKLDDFYIGSEADKLSERGIAGKAYLNKELYIVHITITAEKKFVPSDDDYRFLSHKESEDGDSPPHRSLICVPILDGPLIKKDKDKECLGVVCFDSKKMSVFDSYEVQKKIKLLANHLCAATRTYNELKNVWDLLISSYSN